MYFFVSKVNINQWEEGPKPPLEHGEETLTERDQMFKGPSHLKRAA